MRCELFRRYLSGWCSDYAESLAAIELFKVSTTLTTHQQRTYAAAFQTFRGHFVETAILPTLRLAKDSAVPTKYKDRIVQGVLAPLRDECGLGEEHNIPHDELYQRFANSLGVNADAALWDRECQPESVRLYNRTLHRYLTSCLGRLWADVVRGIAVYLFLERIDEFDYAMQLEFVNRFSLVRELSDSQRARALEFYSVHAALLDRHFESMTSLLDDLWESQEQEIRQASGFLADIHLRMYVGLSKHVLRGAIEEGHKVGRCNGFDRQR